MITTTQVAADTLSLSTAIPLPGGMQLPINAYLVRGTEPVLVDTGLSPLTDEFRAELWSRVDPADLRWIVITHDDRDHTGSLRTILDEAPNAIVITNFISMTKIGEDWPLPMDRLRLVNTGDRVTIGDDVLEAFRPPTYDSPGTLAFHALHRNVCFSSDHFGTFLPASVDLAGTAEDLPATDYHDCVAVFTSANSPWTHNLAMDRWHTSLADLRRRDIATLLSTHGLPISRGLGPLFDAAAGLPGRDAFATPGQEFVDAMLAMAGAGH